MLPGISGRAQVAETGGGGSERLRDTPAARAFVGVAELRPLTEQTVDVVLLPVDVVAQKLDRVAAGRDFEHLSVYTTTLSWWLMRRLRRLGFRVFWPSWVMCSVPLPGLDRYAPTRPPHVL